MGYTIAALDTTEPLLFLLVSSSDHVTPIVGVVPTVTISKNGGAFAAPVGAVSEVGNGWYRVAAAAVDRDTLGPLVLHATATGADPTDEQYDITGDTAPSLAPTRVTSGSTPGTLTVLELLTIAFRRLGIIGAGQMPEPEDTADGLACLNSLIDALQTERLAIYTVTRTTWAVLPGQADYSVGGARPVFVDHVHLIDASGFERGLTLLTDDAYAATRDKTRQGLPVAAYYNPTFPTGTITLYPVPDAAYTGVFYAPNPVQQFGALSDPVSLPPGYRRMLVANLAVELAPEWGVEPPPALVEQARTSKAAIKRSNVRLTDLTLTTPFRRRRVFRG